MSREKRAFLYNDFKNNQSGKPLNLSTWGKILNEPFKRIIILKDQYDEDILGTKWNKKFKIKGQK